MDASDFPNLAKTLVNLAVELLRAPTEYPDLLLVDSDSKTDIRNSTRITLHYATGLLAYGFPVQHVGLQKAATWFSTPFPTNNNHRIDSIEMSRLEAQLSLQPYNEFVLPRLRKLLGQRTPDNYFDIQKQPSSFDTLWALKVLNMARREKLLDSGEFQDALSLDDLCILVDDILDARLQDKDLALALNLRFELFGELTVEQQERFLLNKLINNAYSNNGLWGLTQDLTWIVENMRRQQLTQTEIEQNRESLYKSILYSCYVIENLSPMRSNYRELEPVLREAMMLWWNSLQSDDAISSLRTMFPKPYDYLMILSRTLIAMRAFLKDPLIQWGSTYVYEQMMEQQAKTIDSPERESIKETLRQWIQVDIVGSPEQLKLGLSGANVVRVRPNIRNPLYPDDDAARMNFPESLIIKYGSKADIDEERASYRNLPMSIQGCFVRIPAESYIETERQRAYIIMPDLQHYSTLYEYIRSGTPLSSVIMDQLGPFIIGMHRGANRDPKPVPRGILTEICFLPMQEHIGIIFKYLREKHLFAEKKDQQRAEAIHQKLVEIVGDLTRYQFHLEGFARAYMHGDLHSRNIMIRQSDFDRVGRDRDIDFKLIDLEKFRMDGDAAMDLGQFLTDLKLLIGNNRHKNDPNYPLNILKTKIEEAYSEFKVERRDDLFDTRVKLAQARALIRICKGRTRAIDGMLQKQNSKEAGKEGLQILDLCEEAIGHIDDVFRDMY